jgi:prolipoprotein diacylglyceryl transferase
MLAYLPSPDRSVWHLGPLPIRAYALFILIGIVVAMWLGERRYQARGGEPGVITDLAIWMVPFGVVGGRVYHVITTPEKYFGAGGHPLEALQIWHGGLGIWGAITLGGLGGLIGARRRGLSLGPIADALAPGIVLAQAIGRLGNWFNNELYGAATTLPWGLRVHEWDAATGQAVRDAAGNAVLLPGAYHPTFLYELLWNVGVCLVLLRVDRHRRPVAWQIFALYVALYTAGRFWIEMLRVDEAHHVLGLRLNVWTALVVFVGAVGAFVLVGRRASETASVVSEAADR